MQLKISSNTSIFLKKNRTLSFNSKQISVTPRLAVTALVEFDRRLIRLEGFNNYPFHVYFRAFFLTTTKQVPSTFPNMVSCLHFAETFWNLFSCFFDQWSRHIKIKGTGQTLTDPLLSHTGGLFISDSFEAGGRGLKRREANLRWGAYLI